MDWIYLSPHLDDAVLSCGGMIYAQVQAGERVEICTLFAGDPPGRRLPPFARQLHQRWQTGPEAAAQRRAEDAAACAILGASYRHLPYPDCIYRTLPGSGQPLIRGEDDLFRSSLEREPQLRQQLTGWLAQNLPAPARLVGPLAVGGHADHRLARAALEALDRPLCYYPDYPYTRQPGWEPNDWIEPHWTRRTYALSPQAVQAWQQAVAAYASQISTFWPSLDSMRAAIAAYAETGGGQSLWCRSKTRR